MAVTKMLPLYHDPRFTFRFAEDRIIPASTWKVSSRAAIYKIDPTATGG